MILLLESSIRALMLAAGVAAVLALARVRGGAVRHAAWTAVLIAMLLMPVLSGVVPPIVLRSVTVPAWQLASDPILDPAFTPARRAQAGANISTRAATEAPGVAGQARPASSMQSPAPASEVLPTNWWRIGILLTYAAGVLVLFSRLTIGWMAMRRVVRSSRRTSLVTSDRVYESSAVATPLTVGILTPRIILPSTWPTWSEEVREAVLAHERAHVQRRDALVSLVAQVNRCVFWFHPLAWWLERTIARTAEEACDDAGVRVVPEPRCYADVLVAMASAVRAQGGRVAWQGLGVSGNGLLAQRIERVLRGDAARRPSTSRRVMIVLGSAAVIALAIACQAQTELRPDPAVAAKVAAEEERSTPYRERQKVMDAMTAEKAAAMEIALRTDPTDLGAHLILTEYYTFTYARTEPQRFVELTRPHKLWLIEHAPGTQDTWLLTRFYPRESKTGDLEGYEAGKKLWLAHLAKPDVSARMLRRAASYFEVWDVPKAEELLLRGQAAGLVDPEQPGHVWYADLAQLYINVLLRDAGMMARSDRTPPYDEHAYAQSVRQKLNESNDALLLTTVATWLMPRAVEHDSRAAALRPVADASLERALLLDPQSADAKTLKARIPAMERDARLRRFLYYGPPNLAGVEADLAALADADKFYLLPKLAKQSERKGDDAAYAQARKYAEDALALAPRFTHSPDYSSSVFTAHMTLGLLDMRANRRPDAVSHLLTASIVPPSDDVKVSDLENSLLLVGLLKDNEQAAVIKFLEQMAKVSTSADDQKWLLDSAAKIRKGLMPEWYQRMINAK